MATAPTLLNNIFSGWFTAIEGGELVNTARIINAPITFYAQWSLDYWINFAVMPAGAGTQVSPYIITTAEQLAWIAKQTNDIASWSVDKYVLLSADIDLAGKRWIPIGNFNTGTTISAFFWRF